MRNSRNPKIAILDQVMGSWRSALCAFHSVILSDSWIISSIRRWGMSLRLHPRPRLPGQLAFWPRTRQIEATAKKSTTSKQSFSVSSLSGHSSWSHMKPVVLYNPKAITIPIRLRGDGLVGIGERRSGNAPTQPRVPCSFRVHARWLRRLRRRLDRVEWGAGRWGSWTLHEMQQQKEGDEKRSTDEETADPHMFVRSFACLSVCLSNCLFVPTYSRYISI